MPGKIEIKDNAERYTLSIRIKTKMENLPNIIGTNYMKIMAYLNELGEQPIDVPFTAYYNLDMQSLDVEMGFIVNKALPAKDEIKAGIISKGKTVNYMYKGPYSEMQKDYEEIMKWISDNKYELTGVYYEYYYNSPAEVPERELLTRIELPLK